MNNTDLIIQSINNIANAIQSNTKRIDTNNKYIFTHEYIENSKGKRIYFKTKAFKHQIECLQKFSDYKAFALLCEMGTGKTWIIINNFAYLALRGLVDHMIVIAPNGVHSSWVNNELPLHLPTALKDVSYKAYNGSLSSKENLEVLKFVANSTIKHKILCVNWASLSNKKGVNILEKFAQNSKKLMIVLDESHNIKDPTTKRAKSLEDLAKYAKYKRIMSGSPITNSPFDAFTQFNFLDENILNCTSFIAFKHRYGVFLPQSSPLVQSIKNRSRAKNVLIPLTKNGIAQYKDLDKLQALIRPYSFRVLKKDCLDLPKKIYKNEYIELSTKQRLAYEQLKKQGFAILNDDTITINNKIVLLTKLAQITSNNVILEDGGVAVIDEKNNPKLERTIEIIKECISNKQSVILWCRYKNEIQNFIDTFKKEKISFVKYFGGVSDTERKESIENFQSGKASVFLSNVQSGGTGLTLTRANVMIYYSNSFSVSDRMQSEDRIHRIGQQSNVLYINIIAHNTIDEHIINILDTKRTLAHDLIDFNNTNDAFIHEIINKITSKNQ